MDYQRLDWSQRAFARTNEQTVRQRADLVRQLLPHTAAIAEICCGDCLHQWQIYTQTLGIARFQGLDIDPQIVALNRARGITCHKGDALNPEVMRHFLADEVLFFGPPLSVDCNGHQGLAFREVTPSYADFCHLLLGELQYNGTLVCICPKTTSMGDIAQLYAQVQGLRPDFGLRLIHHSYATRTGAGQETELRLKYVELWLTNQLADQWEVLESKVAKGDVFWEEVAGLSQIQTP
jgi:hypothetical protein